MGFSTPYIAAKASSAFIYFCAFKSISAIVLEGFFAKETTNSLDFNPALKVVSCTLSSASSTSKVSRVKRVTYDLRVSFFPCLMVSKWSVGLFGRCPPTKWWEKELPSCSKLSMDDVGSLVNHSLATPLRVVGKEWHSISSGGCWRPKVILKVLRMIQGILQSVMVKGEFVLLTILSRLWYVFSLFAFVSLSISFLISLRRFELAPYGVASRLF